MVKNESPKAARYLFVGAFHKTVLLLAVGCGGTRVNVHQLTTGNHEFVNELCAFVGR